MSNAVEHAEIVFSAIFPSRPDLLDKALSRLSEKHFVEETHKGFFRVLERYYHGTSQVIPEHYLDDVISDPSKRLLYSETYRSFESREVTDAEFIWSVEQLIEQAAHRATLAALTEAMVITRQGKLLPNGDTLRGAQDAREFLNSELATIDKDLVRQASPEGDLRREEDSILDEYAERKRAHREGRTEGIRFGIPELDTKVGGMQPGELILVAGYSSDGKTSLAVQAAWSACVEQGKNVLFLTTETLRPQVARKIIARHSKRDMFNIPDGLNTKDLKAGTLTEEQEFQYAAVVQEFAQNPAYGHLYVAQVPRGASISSIEQTMYRVQRQFNIDLVVMDYLALLRPDAKKPNTREELASIMKEAKQVATTFNDGAGVPFLSPWQVSRMAKESADAHGLYTSASLSETAEATNSADVIVSLLAPADNTDRKTEVTLQVLKNRDGETANGIIVEVDYATSCFKGRSSFRPAKNAFSSGLDAFS